MEKIQTLIDDLNYLESMLCGGYDGDEKDVWESLHAAFHATKEQIRALKLNGGNGKNAHEGNCGNGCNGKAKPRANGGERINPDNGKPEDFVTDNEEAIYAQELG